MIYLDLGKSNGIMQYFSKNVHKKVLLSRIIMVPLKAFLIKTKYL